MDNGILSLKWNHHKTTFFHVLSTIRKKESYTDVTLVCDDQFYPVHKLVLATCSDYFSRVLEKINCKSPFIMVTGITKKDLEYLIEYMYCGEVEVPQTDLTSLIKSAESLKIKGLATTDEESSAEDTQNVPPEEQKQEQTHTECAIEKPYEEESLKIQDRIKVEEEDPVDNSFMSIDATSHEHLPTTFEESRPGESKNEYSSPFYQKEYIHKYYEDKKHLCDFCQRGFASKQSLRRHLLRHTGEKPFQCPICSIRFRHKLTRNTHVLTHKEEKPFACQLCTYKCYQKRTLQTHIIKHHSSI